MKMYLNDDATKYVEITSYTRNLDVGNPDIRFRLDMNFNGDYSAEGIEYLADFANEDITDIEIKDDNNVVQLASFDIRARVNSLSETCNEDGKYGYASLIIYENTSSAS